MAWIFAIATAIYTTFLFWLDRGVAHISKEDRDKPFPSDLQPISIIIAAKNELSNLPRLLKSLSELDYPSDRFELIIVNDHSTDGSREYLQTQTHCPNLKHINYYHETSNLIGKKAAIQQGIDAAQYDILAFTDADCIVPPSWLREINRGMTQDTDYMLSYSIIKHSPTDGIMRLKNFERSAYYALASAGLYYHIPFTSMACNMVYRKSLFTASGGFNEIGHLASGDDDLLLMKMMPNVRKAAYNCSPDMQICSIDGIDPVKHHHTNIRRASKFFLHPWWLQGLSLFIFMYFVLFYYQIAMLVLGRFHLLMFICLLIKTGTELYFSLHHLTLISRTKLGALYPVQILLFPAQFIFYALRGTLGKYRWK